MTVADARRTAYTYPGAAGAGGAALPADELTSTTNTRVHTTTLWDDNGDPIVTTWTGTSTPRLPTTTSTTKAAVVTTTPDAETTTEAAAGGAAKQPQGGNKGIQGPPTTTYPPMTATTYGYKNQAGDWVTTQWTQSYTAPTEATAAVSSGSIQGLQEYKDSQKGMTDKAVQPGSVKASGASGRVASGAVVALVAGVLSYIL